MQRMTGPLANPFLCPEFSVAVGHFRPNARVAVLADGPQIIGFFPFERRRLGVGVPIGAGLNDRQGLIHVPGAEWDPRELLRRCNILVWQFDHLAAGQWFFERYAASVNPSPVIDLSRGFADYQHTLRAKSPRFCSDTARKARKLERETGDLRFVVDSRDRHELRALMRWKSDQYRRTGLVDVFSRPWIVGLAEYLLDIHGDRFSSLLSLLYAGDILVAAHFGLRYGHVLGHWFPAYDKRFSSRSPGLIQHLWMAREVSRLPVHLIDMGTGGERYKQQLKSYDLFVSEGMAARGPVATSAHHMRIALRTWAGGKARSHPSVFRPADRLLRHYGRIA